MSCAIAVMAKAPRAGHSKTRLTPPLLPDEARQMSAAFLRDITENIRLAGQQADIAGYVAYAPAGMEALFDGVLADGTGLVLADGTGDMPEGVHGFGPLAAARDAGAVRGGAQRGLRAEFGQPDPAHILPGAGGAASGGGRCGRARRRG